MSNIPDFLQREYEMLHQLRGVMETMKKQQELRGVEAYKQRMAHRAATHKTWRQMRGVQLFMHEINHPGNQPFVIAFGITTSALMYLYFAGLRSEQAKKDSTYWQRFHAKHDDHAPAGHHH